MPLMMDDSMDIDDLFGDGAGLSLPPHPPAKVLSQRVDELRGIGCCQSIAWSKWGSIASIAQDGYALELRNLRRHPSNGEWALSDPTVTPQLTSNLDGGPLKHLSWSPTGSELAVVDASGRITILSLFSSLNKPTLSRIGQSDPAEDLHAVVGCYWLNLSPVSAKMTTIIYGPALRKGNQYLYEASQNPVLGPCHPNHSKSAFVCLTTNGLLRVLWPQNGTGKWVETHTEIESVVSSDDLISHAAICPDKSNTVLIAFTNAARHLRVIRAHIDWGVPKGSEKLPPSTVPLNPIIRTRHVAMTTWLQATSGDLLNTSSIDLSLLQLSHLEFLPLCTDSTGRQSPPTILAVLSHLPTSTSHFGQDMLTTIERWEIREKTQIIHPAFEQVSSKRSSTGQAPQLGVFLRSLDSITVNKIAIAVQPMHLGKIISFTYQDGSVDFRERSSFNEMFNEIDLDKIWHPSQVGISYNDDEPCLQVAYSPSYCSMVQIKNNGKTIWRQPEYQFGDIGFSMEDAQYAAIIASLGVTIATVVTTAANYDDLLAISNKYSKGTNFAYDWLMELSKILKVNVDYSEDATTDLLIRNTLIQFCLSIQNSLGFQGEFNPRAFAGKHAWIGLQLRNIVVLFTMASNMMVPSSKGNSEKHSPLDDPEVINALSGSIRWVLDLMAWITDTLLTLPNTVPTGMDLTDVSSLSLSDLLFHLRCTNDISLHLLLSSPTRGFLTAILRRMGTLEYYARRALQHPTGTSNSSGAGNPAGENTPKISPELRTAYLQIAQLVSVSIIRINTFSTLLTSTTQLVKAAYSSATNPQLSGSPTAEKQRNLLEMKMLFGGPIPNVFKSVIVELFEGVEMMPGIGHGGNIDKFNVNGSEKGLLWQLREEIDPAKLFFADFEMLEVEEEESCVRKRKGKGLTMDCFRKTWLKNPSTAAETATAVHGKIDLQRENLAHALGEQPKSALMANARWRRCPRCTSVMEDVLSTRQALQWLVMQQRRCFCSGYWNTVAPGEFVT